MTYNPMKDIEENNVDKTYVFLRHGEIYYGSWIIWRITRWFFSDIDDPPLSEKGFTNAKEVGNILKTKNINVDFIRFEVNAHNQEGDWRSEYASVYKLDEVICKGKME